MTNTLNLIVKIVLYLDVYMALLMA